MIKFFRNIRQTLIMENKTSKYLKYAIGEIVLVMIGILLALQVNNWNEGRKQKTIELELLSSLNSDLDANIDALKRVLVFDSLVVVSNKIIINVLNDPYSTYNDSLNFHFGKSIRSGDFKPQKLTYESLKSIGFNNITNNKVRNEIIKLYDSHYANSNSADEFIHNYFLEINRIYNNLFSTGSTVFNKIPNDFEALKTNTIFKNNFTAMAAEYENLPKYRKWLLEETNGVKTLIAKEIEILTQN